MTETPRLTNCRPQKTKDRTLQTAAESSFVFLLVLIAFLWFLPSSHLAGTEAHRAIPAHQMVTSGDWLVPRFWGVPYLAKPPLHYWILAVSESFFNTSSEWVFRFPSALSAALSALLIYFATRRWFPNHPPAPLYAGLTFLALIPLWSQNGKADIDANHTFALTLCAVGLIELGLKKRTACPRSAFAWTILTALAFAATLLLKGPAGLPVILGIILGPSILIHKRTFLKRPHIWIALTLGCAIFATWAVAVYFKINSEQSDFDWMGISEVGRNLSTIDFSTIIQTITLPAILFVYALPISAIALVAFLYLRTDNHDADTPRETEAREFINIILTSIIAAFAIAMLARMSNPRYMYIALPLLAPIVGYHLAQWSAPNRFPVATAIRTTQLVVLGAVAALVTHLSIVISIRFQMNEKIPWWMVLTVAISILLTAGFALALRARRRRLALICILATLLAATPSFAFERTAKRIAESSYNAGLVLRKIVGPNATVYSGNWIRNGPELPYYAGVNVIYRLKGQFTPETTPPNSWVLLQDGEYKKWADAVGEDRLDEATILPTRRNNAIIARFLGP